MVAFPRDDWLQSSRAEFESASALVLEDAIMWPADMFATQDELMDGNYSPNAQDEVEADSSVGSASVAEYSDHPVADTPPTSPPACDKGQNPGAPVQPTAHSRSPRVGFSRESLARINSVLSPPSQSASRVRTASGSKLPSTVSDSPSSTSLASRLGPSINDHALPIRGDPPSTPHRGERRRKSSPRKVPRPSPRAYSTTSTKNGHRTRRPARSD